MIVIITTKKGRIMQDEKIDALYEAARLLADNEINVAEQIINEKYPFIPIRHEKRRYTARQLMNQFFNDGFIDRYSGKKLINPGMLRTMSTLMPTAFPYQSAWKTDECHIAYWDYYPTLDHIFPVALGGKDTSENWVTTSMACNSAKSNFTLEELGLTLKDKGDLKKWDGLSELFVKIVDRNTSLLDIKVIKDWYTVTKETMKKFMEPQINEIRKKSRIQGSIATLRNIRYTDEDIKSEIMKQYGLTKAEADRYIQS